MSNIDAKLVYTDPTIDHKFSVELDEFDIRRLIKGYTNAIDNGQLPKRIKEYRSGLMIDRLGTSDEMRKLDVWQMEKVPFYRHMHNHFNYQVKNGYKNESTGKKETKQFRNWFRYKTYFLESMEAYYESIIQKICHFSSCISYDCSHIIEEINVCDKLQRSYDYFWEQDRISKGDTWED